jgi:hypothetical protein
VILKASIVFHLMASVLIVDQMKETACRIAHVPSAYHNVYPVYAPQITRTERPRSNPATFPN